MIRWKYIAMKLAKRYSSPGNLAHWTEEHLARSWTSLFDVDPQSYSDPKMMSGNYAIVYNFIMTIAIHLGDENEGKVNDILKLMKEIAGRVDYDEAAKIFEEGGYNLKISVDEEPKELLRFGKFHSQIVEHCEKFFKQGHFTTCINEACKAYNKAVQKKSNSTRDGQDLMLWAFSEKSPLKVNAYETESEINEQEGIKFLSAGLMRGFRNPTSHETAASWKKTQEECVEILSLASYLFKQLDKATIIT